ncbi:MAG: hypothetical protein MJ002_03330 [Paludibacteraceae bacterium]|nr:hypothetical protein [Paludibacteraceae bacterium]
MKGKIVVLLLTVSVLARAGGYRHSVGISFGTINGVSYKGYVSNNIHFVLQVDAYWQMGLTPNSSLCSTFTQGDYKNYNMQVRNSTLSGGEYQSAMIEPGFMYQGKIGRWELGNMYWFAGGSIGFGALWEGKFDDASLICKPDQSSRPWFKMSEHLLMGVEFSFNAVPLVLGIELRPGMATPFMTSGGNIYDNYKTLSAVMFDWGANFTLRYCFGEEK